MDAGGSSLSPAKFAHRVASAKLCPAGAHGPTTEGSWCLAPAFAEL